MLKIYHIPAIRFSPLYFFQKYRELSLLSGLRHLLPLLFMLFFFSAISFTQNSTIDFNSLKGKKIGLVLSGGGAKGLAHIGVLKVIDSLGIKIDYIGGSSMGGIIGGLYAYGYSGKQLDELFAKLDVDKFIQDITPRNSKSPFEKSSTENYALTLPFNDFKIGTPSSISKGIFNYNLLVKLTQKSRGNIDFKKLSIPFFCIATDIVNGKEILIEEGNIAKTLVATGTVPSLFSPLEVDGKLLVDGGIINNYPVEELRNKGMDFIIGVDVQDILKSEDELNSVTKIFQQVSVIGVTKKMESKIPLTDIYIKPNINKFNILSFEVGEEIIKSGELAAIDALTTIGNPKNPLSKPEIPIEETLCISNINFNELNSYTRSYLLGKLRLIPNNIITYNKLYQAVLALNDTDNFEQISYEIDTDNNLNFFLKETKNNMLVKFGLHYDDVFKSAALVNFTKRKIITKNDYFSVDMIVGDKFRYNANYLLDNGYHWSFGFNSSFSTIQRTVNFSNSDDLNINGVQSLGLNFFNFSNKLFTQSIFIKNFIAGAGIEFQNIRVNSPNLEVERRLISNENFGSAFTFLNYDTLNDKIFVKKGFYLNSKLQYYFYSTDRIDNIFEPLITLKGELGFAIPITKKLSFQFQTDGGTNFGANRINVFNFSLGNYGYREFLNLKPFYGYDIYQRFDNSYLKTLGTIQFEFYKKNFLNVSYNLGIIGNDIFSATKNWITKPNMTGIAIGYGLDSFLGPIEFKYSWSPEIKQNFLWFNVGYTF